MAANVETLGTLERRVSMSVPVEEVERQVDERLKKLARNIKMSGFRPGKVPLKLVQQQYGPQVRSEVVGDAVRQAFADAVKTANLKVAGYPRIEPKQGGDAKQIEFDATFEVYPEVSPGDVSARAIERPQVTVDDGAVERTIEILRKQRTTYVAAARGARYGDRLTVDFDGTIDGVAFAGGKGSGVALVLGEGRMLADFEASARGMAAGETKTFEVKFPDDYHARDVAGKTATFTLSVKQAEEPKLPALDQEFARSLGVADGDLAAMRKEVKANVEREVAKRVEAKLKEQSLQALLDATPLELPKALVELETRNLVQRAAADLQARGVKIEQVPLDPAAFEAGAKRRVALALIISEVAKMHGLQPKPDQVRKLIEQEAQSYESPAEVVKWFYMQPQRLSEMEGLALEGNVVNWVLSKAKVVDKAVPFDDMMSGG